jgi:hypothetical protein
MANPNVTVARARSAKSAKVKEEVKGTRSEADTLAEEWRKDGLKVRIASFKLGPRNRPVTKYTVRAYKTVEEES